MGCGPTYGPPVEGDCDNWNGCGDTVGVSEAVAAAAQVGIVVQAGRLFTPRLFIYTGPAASFEIVGVTVANGANAHFGAPYAADVYAVGSFTPKAVNWPTFSNAPGLTITVLSIAAQEETFSGVLYGIAEHVK
jgi:hypothetical protein